MSQGSIVVATAPVRQYQLGYVGDYFESVTQECLCLLFGNMAVGIGFDLFFLNVWEKTNCFLFGRLHSKNHQHMFLFFCLKSQTFSF